MLLVASRIYGRRGMLEVVVVVCVCVCIHVWLAVCVCCRCSIFRSHGRSGANWGLGKPKRSQRNRKGRSLSVLSLSSLSIRDRDLPLHAARLYFSGTNVFGSPFRLSTVPPPSLEPFVFADLFAEFVAVVNKAVHWPLLGWELLVYLVLLLVCYPLSRVFLDVSKAWLGPLICYVFLL